MGLAPGKNRALLAAVTTLVAASCAPSPATDRDGGPAPTIVSLNPCIDAILVEIAEPDQIIALSHYSRDPSGSSIAQDVAQRFAITGGTAEEVIALAPDIVFASTFIAPATKAALEQAGLQVETFGSPRSVAESQTQIQRMARVMGDPSNPAAQRLSREIGVALWPPIFPPPAPGDDPLRTARDPSVLLWQPGQIVAGEQTLIAELLRQEGFANHSAAKGLGQADHVALEAVLADPPDVLLVAGKSAGQQHPALTNLKNTRVRTFDPALLYCAGPTIQHVRMELNALRWSFEPGDAGP